MSPSRRMETLAFIKRSCCDINLGSRKLEKFLTFLASAGFLILLKK